MLFPSLHLMNHCSKILSNTGLGFDETGSEDELRKIMADIYAENTKRREQVNSTMRITSSVKDENEKHEKWRER